MNTILFATDGSPSAANAASTALELAQSTGWDLRVVSVWSVPTMSYGFAPMVSVPALGEDERTRAAEVLADAVEAARAAGLEPLSELRQGRAVEEICAAAEESSATLIVLGAHGWGAVRRLLAGSVSTGVLRHAPCPVLIVRAAPAAAEDELATMGVARSDG